MATSGSTNFTANANDIIAVALRQCGVLGEGEDMTDEQRSETILPLNMLVKTWQAAGLYLSAVKTAYLFPEVGKNDHKLTNSVVYSRQGDFTGSSDLSIQDQYAYGPLQTYTLTDEWTGTQGDGNWVYYSTTELTEGIQVGDLVGIYNATEATREWGQVTAHEDVSGEYRFQVTGGSGSTIPAAVGDTIYVLTKKAPRPLKILEAYVRQAGQVSDIPIDVVSRNEYDALSTKQSTGIPNQIHYDPQRDSGICSIWPQTDDPRTYITLRIKAPIEDFDAGTDEVDLPQEWLLPLAMNLALLMAPSYGVPAEDFKKIALLADMYYNMVFDFEQETETSVYFQPGY